MVSKEEYLNYVDSLISQEDKQKYSSTNKKKIGQIFFAIGGVMIFASILLILLRMFSRNNNFNFAYTFIFLAMFGSMVCFVVGSVLQASVNKTFIELEQKYKDKIIEYLLKDYNHYFLTSDFIPRDVLYEAQVLKGRVDDYSGEDKLILNIPNDDGTKSNTNLVISDIKATREEENNDGEKYTVTVFSGAFGYVELPFYFKSSLTINSTFRASKPLQKVSLEDIKFNKAMRVCCDDQVEARYILTPEVMQKLMMLKTKLGHFQLVLDRNKMYLTIPGKNLFRLNRNSKSINATNFYDFYNDINALVSLIKDIQTNNKVFKM